MLDVKEETYVEGGIAETIENTTTEDAVEFPTRAEDALLPPRPNRDERGSVQLRSESKNSSKATSFIDKSKFGVYDPDEGDIYTYAEADGKTPQTKRRIED